MDLMKLTDMGYEIMAMVPTKDDAYDYAEEYMKCPIYAKYAIAPYKNSSGLEDAFAVLLITKLEMLEQGGKCLD